MKYILTSALFAAAVLCGLALTPSPVQAATTETAPTDITAFTQGYNEAVAQAEFALVAEPETDVARLRAMAANSHLLASYFAATPRLYSYFLGRASGFDRVADWEEADPVD